MGNKGCDAAYALQPLNPGRKTLLFDRAHVEAVAAGRTPPATTATADPHPADLLDEQDAAEELGVTYATVRHDRAVVRPPGWMEVCGVALIKRATLARVIATRPGRGVSGGRPRKSSRPRSTPEPE
ncbi:hypothetical protein [Acrocarpospora catenulata]|uniref:hypothetical protein n=1 Tax=Acrocarpospora catenulata TaxID=2836182 RepID=UPI001BDAA700|nr:hypothetical protein [Acrocarpospora catenulata]